MAKATATPKEPREPWIKVKIGLRRSDKIASLPGPAARWGWTCALLEAKTQRRMGIFISRRHLAEMLGPEGKFVGAFITAGLAHEVPARGRPWTGCESGRCQRDYDDARPGEVVVHDYRKEQRDPTHADRQADYRDRNRGDDGPDEPPASPSGDGGSDAPRDGGVTPEVTPEVTDRVTDGVTQNVTPLSRARGTTVTVTETVDVVPRATPVPRGGARTLGSPSDDVRLTAEQLAAWSTFGAVWEPFRVAWLARGFRWPPMGGPDDDDTTQRGLLWQVVDSAPTVIAVWVREAPGTTTREVIDHVLAKYHEARQAVDDEELEWEATKAADRASAPTAMARITEGLIAASLNGSKPADGAEAAPVVEVAQ